jgi:hypothetical protein
MRKVLLHFLSLLSALALVIPWTGVMGAGQPCIPDCFAPNDPTGGTASLPANCPYVTLTDKMHITDGLPSGTTIEITAQLHGFFNIVNTSGGSLGGDREEFEGSLQLDMKGTGTLSGFSRLINVPVGGSSTLQIDNAPRGSGSLQSFGSDLFRLFGQITGDPDFDLLRIVAGTDFGMPSPGHTTLIRQGGGTTWLVKGFFDITYRIDFVGAPGGAVAGMSGSTTATVRIDQGGHKFWTPADGSVMSNPQLPNPMGWDVYGVFPIVLGDDWLATETTPVKDIHFWGSWLNDIVGGINSFDITIREDVPAGIDLPYSHPGVVLWQRNISNFCVLPIIPTTLEGWYDPSSGTVIPNNHNQYFQYDVDLDEPDWFNQTQSKVYWLCITANLTDPLTSWGWKSTLSHFSDDAVWLQSLPSTCPSPDNGTGTTDLPAQCPYLTTPSGGTFDIINGLPPGSQINSTGMLFQFFNVIRTPGGSLGGETDDFQAFLNLTMTGTGALGGFSRNITLPVGGGGSAQMDHGPRTPGMAIQDFPSDMLRIQGQITGDPDFDLLRITAGTAFGMPSPGHTTLTKISGGHWNVDSFFDITYRIDFVGHPGGPLSGMSGSTTATIRIQQGGPPPGNWIDLHEPPSFGSSMDLAFVITNGATAAPCLCKPGDANGDAAINISDAVYLIAYIFSGGLAPTPYATCSGDANKDCAVNISDAVYLIAYIFAGGAAPSTCEEWQTQCGPPFK